MKKYLYITLFFLSLTTYGFAQVVLDGQAEVSNVKIQRRGAQLDIAMDVNVTPVDYKSNKELQLTPRLTNKSEFIDLPSIVVAGRKSMIYRKRNPEYFANENNQVVIRKNKNEEQVVNYATTVDFESWMNGADLVVVENDCGCASTVLASNEHGLDRFLLPPAVLTPVLRYVEPAVEVRKDRSIHAQAYLDFPIGKSNIHPNYRNNAAELDKIKASINAIINDGDIQVSTINLKGHASPEGSYRNNERLARERTNALKTHLVSIYPQIPAKSFVVDFMAENWEGLINMLNDQSSLFAYKDDVLRIINSTTDLDARERQIRALDGGKAFRALLNDYFPALRNTNYEIKYIVRDFTPQEAKEIVWTKPQKLSLEEIYSVTKLYEANSDEYAELFEIAVRMYPEDDIANLNASTSALLVKDLPRAKRHLDKVSSSFQDAEYFNNLGVYYLLNENYGIAKDSFDKAIVKGSDSAKENLKQLEVKVEELELLKK